MGGFTVEKVKGHFAAKGPIKEIIPGYRYRSEQVCLAEKISRVFIEQEFLVAEAGTGIGKTFAYLIPAVLWAVNKQEKLVISTKTKALQEQIIEQDIPNVQKIIGVDFTYAEAKGRENYLCWNKYEKIRIGRTKLKTPELQFINSILLWAEKTKTGDRKELSLDSELMKNWGLIASDRKTCLKSKCRYRERCFHSRMIKGLEKADIIITNHALLLSDILVNNQILPEYKNLIIDEAHAFTRVAFEKMSSFFPYAETLDMLKVFNYLDNPEKVYLRLLVKEYPETTLLCKEINGLTKIVISIIGDVFRPLSQEKGSGSNYRHSQVVSERCLERVEHEYQNYQETIFALTERLEELKNELNQKDAENELITIIDVLTEYFDCLFRIIVEDSKNDDKIIWAEYSRGKAILLASSDVHIGKLLESALYSKLNSLVMVSGTIAVEKKFDFFCNFSGLSQLNPPERLVTMLKYSPFDYDSQATVYIAQDMPEPNQDTYNKELYRYLGDIFAVTKGKTLILFTSRQQMKETAKNLRPLCLQSGLELLVQYQDGEFSNLIGQFKRSPNTILMGVETFWEGIDLKGELLKCLVIVRLPFRPPSDPYGNAGNKFFNMQNKNGFINFTIPDTVTRFKQGVGRLIRSETDSGAVIILDNRLGKRSYTKVFLNSIPMKNIIYSNLSEISQNIAPHPKTPN